MLDSLRHRVETDYAGYTLEVAGHADRAYRSAFQTFQRDAARAEGDACLEVLNHYLGWFHDPHLFVFQSTRLDTAETGRRAAAVQILDAGEAAVRVERDARAGRLDPIEGVWYDDGLRVAVVPETGAPAGRFVAVVLRPDTTIWRRGAVRARFTREPNGHYRAHVWSRNYAERLLDVTIHKRVLMRMDPGIWGRAWPVDSAETPTLDPDDPHRATLIHRDGAIVISIPSHDPTYRGTLDTLLAEHADELAAARLLVIDLRGNEGGSSWVTRGLMPYVMSEHLRPSRYAAFTDAVMLASTDQEAYARRAFGSDTSAFVRSLLRRMEARPGALVPLNDPTEAPSPEEPDSVIPGARRVGILIDGGTVSASEVLVARALRSERATVFGEPTAGALDYQSVNIVPFAPGQRRWYLGYPTIAASARLPEGGMRGHGIAPQVRLDLEHLRDPIGTVIRALAAER